MKKLLIGLFALIIIFTRFYNVENTARFTRDESSDLSRMYQYYQNRQLSLVGPISSEQDKVFSSLSYYMVMPFAIAFGFTPVSVVYGMSFFGVLSAFLLLIIAYKTNSKKILLAGALICVWFPLLTVSRWAWNPHFVIFWTALALAIYFYKEKIGTISFLIIGVALGALFHHHYVAILTTAPFVFFLSLPYLQKKEYKPVLLLVTGYILPHLLFVLFDLKNPPGLFFGKYLLSGNTPHIETGLSLAMLGAHFVRNVGVYLETFIQNTFLQVVFGMTLITLIFLELRTHLMRTLTWVIPATAILFGGVFLDEFQIRYVYSSILFIFVWLLFERKKFIPKLLSSSALVFLLLGSLLTVRTQLTQTEVNPPMSVVTTASEIISNTIATKQLKNVNVAALSSKDSAPLAEKYRDYLGMRGTQLRAASEYDASENLFIVTSATQEELLQDQSYAMQIFKNTKLQEIFIIDSQWKVFWYATN